MNKLLSTAAMVGVLVATATSATAADAPKTKCYGIAAKGKNDCKAANGSHSCAGQAKADKDANDFKNVASEADCTKEGGKTAAPAAKAAAATPSAPAATATTAAPSAAKAAAVVAPAAGGTPAAAPAAPTQQK